MQIKGITIDPSQRSRVFSEPPKIHYEISVHSKVMWDGQTPCPPAVGDTIHVDDETLRVVERHWLTAGDVLGSEATTIWGHGAADHVCVRLHCEVVR